jgi:hypothetical protein
LKDKNIRKIRNKDKNYKDKEKEMENKEIRDKSKQA